MSYILFDKTDLGGQGEYVDRIEGNVATCITSCNADNRCFGFAHSGIWCYLKKPVSNPYYSYNNDVNLYIKTEHLQNQSDRTQIDNRVAEIYGAQGTVNAAFEENYRTTMLVGVGWAMLGTTVLYYTFKNL